MCEAFRAGWSVKKICDFFGLRVEADEYLEVMRTTVKPLMDDVARRRGQEDNYVFQAGARRRGQEDNYVFQAGGCD